MFEYVTSQAFPVPGVSGHPSPDVGFVGCQPHAAGAWFESDHRSLLLAPVDFPFGHSWSCVSQFGLEHFGFGVRELHLPLTIQQLCLAYAVEYVV